MDKSIINNLFLRVAKMLNVAIYPPYITKKVLELIKTARSETDPTAYQKELDMLSVLVPRMEEKKVMVTKKKAHDVLYSIAMSLKSKNLATSETGAQLQVLKNKDATINAYYQNINALSRLVPDVNQNVFNNVIKSEKLSGNYIAPVKVSILPADSSNITPNYYGPAMLTPAEQNALNPAIQIPATNAVKTVAPIKKDILLSTEETKNKISFWIPVIGAALAMWGKI
jgi:hypothetical protein